MRTLFALWCVVFFLETASAETFEVRPRLMPVGPNPSAIAAADLTGDGIPEIVTCDRGILDDPREEHPGNNELSLLIAKAPLEYVQQHPSPRTDTGPYAVVLANVDGLKWPDIIAANFLASNNEDISVFLNLQQEGIYKPLGFGVPDDPLPYLRQRDGDGVPLFTKPGLTALAVRDFNEDRLRDLVATAWCSDRLVVMPGHLEKIFDTPKLIVATGGPRDLAVGDFDRNGKADLAVAMYCANEIALFQGDGQNGFSEVSRFPSRGRLPNHVRVSDMNGDGMDDIVVSHAGADDSMVIFLGGGDFRFSTSREIMLGENRESLEYEIRDFTIADFNLDGRPDLAAACFASGTVEVFMAIEPDGPLPLFRRETYRFGKGESRARPRALCAADFDGSGSPDLAVALWDADAAGLMLSTAAKKEPAPAEEPPNSAKRRGGKVR